MMTITLRCVLFIASIVAFILCVRRIKESKLKVTNSIVWMVGSIGLIIMSIFPGIVKWVAIKLGFAAPVNFVFLVFIAFLLMQTFIDNIRICSLNEKIKELNHYIALKEVGNETKEKIIEENNKK